jgi:hypothetical protein
VKIDGMPVDMQIAAAVAREVQTVLEAEGQAALDLIRSAGAPPRETQPATGPDGRGSLINTTA